MAQQIKTLVAKTMTWVVSQDHVIEGENSFPQVFLWPSNWHCDTYAYNIQGKKWKNKTYQWSIREKSWKPKLTTSMKTQYHVEAQTCLCPSSQVLVCCENSKAIPTGRCSHRHCGFPSEVLTDLIWYVTSYGFHSRPINLCIWQFPLYFWRD